MSRYTASPLGLIAEENAFSYEEKDEKNANGESTGGTKIITLFSAYKNDEKHFLRKSK